MNAAAEAVMKELSDLVLAYGNSDEYRYVLALSLEQCNILRRDAAATLLAHPLIFPLVLTGSRMFQSMLS